MDFIGKVIKASRISKKISIQEASSELKISTQILKKTHPYKIMPKIHIFLYMDFSYNGKWKGTFDWI